MGVNNCSLETVFMEWPWTARMRQFDASVEEDVRLFLVEGSGAAGSGSSS